MIYFERGSETDSLTSLDLQISINAALSKLGPRKKVLVIPPDFTRFHSRAGEITQYICEYYGNAVTDILPALGTHFAMSPQEIEIMFGKKLSGLIREHNWRTDIVKLGDVPSGFIHQVSEGKLNYSWPAQVNKLLVQGNYDLILSVGQVVPHEVIGMANFNKNIFVGTGGAEGINKSHFLGAVYGMERIMGRADTPVRKVLNYASKAFSNHLPIVYIQTVLSKDSLDNKLKLRGLYIGNGVECFEKASDLSLKVNFKMLEKPLKKVVVYLPPEEFKSTWLGNKSIYRTRMAIEDNGELIVIAPGVREFGEDKQIDKLIRKFGYKTTPEILEFIKNDPELASNLSAAAHLIHGSSENRFSITYCTSKLSEGEIKSVNYNHQPLDEIVNRYNPNSLKDGYNTVDGEEIFFISNPALGLWAHKDRFN
ncbi:MAG TPA: D-mannonate epimerase [Bacteroidales bacterium]|nr:D-mannonate epimerase [Bacteroidales bacterium]